MAVSVPIATQLTERELAGVLTHELAHIRRGDTVTGWLLHMVRDLMFFSPFSTLLLDRAMLERERICDRDTVAALGSSHGYAGTLLKVWRLLLDRQELRLGLTAGFTGKKRDLEVRVHSLLDGEQQKELPGVVFLTLLFSLATVTVLYLGQIC